MFCQKKGSTTTSHFTEADLQHYRSSYELEHSRCLELEAALNTEKETSRNLSAISDKLSEQLRDAETVISDLRREVEELPQSQNSWVVQSNETDNQTDKVKDCAISAEDSLSALVSLCNELSNTAEA